ncbi:hypothetical protein ACHAXS_014475 [Conticribra weissflogii]
MANPIKPKPTKALRNGSRRLLLPLLPTGLFLISISSVSAAVSSFFVAINDCHYCHPQNIRSVHHRRDSSQQSFFETNFPRRKSLYHAASDENFRRKSSNSNNEEITKASTITTTTSETAAKTSAKGNLSQNDIRYLKKAAQIARIGYGNTFPNPAVGCLLYRDDDDAILGAGFHPKAGMPHAEIFALFQACGYVRDGVAAARSAMRDDDKYNNINNNNNNNNSNNNNNNEENETLVNDQRDGKVVTAYVTLEPCCHYGQTPPCALSLVTAGVNRVVVGYRDPNPRVDGGGIQLLRDAGVDVLVIGGESGENFASKEERQVGKMCADLVKYFVKRISPDRTDRGKSDLDDSITGAKRRALRQITGRKKTEGTMPEVEWPRGKQFHDIDYDADHLKNIPIPTHFLETVDNTLWDQELVLLRLNNVVKKKKGAKILGERVAEVMNGHVAQVLGHTVLIYRPGSPAVLDLDEIVAGSAGGGDDGDE